MRPPPIIALILAVVITSPAGAVLIASGDGTGNTSAPPNVGDSSWIEDPGWINVGSVDLWTGVFLGGGWMLTANHVAPNLEGISIVLDDVPYSPVIGSNIQLLNPEDDSATDLKLFLIHAPPALGPVQIRSDAMQSGDNMIMVGYSRSRGTETKTVCSPPNQVDGWFWSGGKAMRWGTNEVSLVNQTTGSGLLIHYFTSVFGRNLPTDHEAVAISGDSGGAVFIKQGSTWYLAGIIFGSTTYGGASVMQKTGCVAGSETFSVDLPYYRDQIVEITTQAVVVVAGLDVAVTALGGSSLAGGVDLTFADTNGGWVMPRDDSVSRSGAASLLSDPTEIAYSLPSDPLHVWDLEFHGELNANVALTFGYDEAALLPGTAESDLQVYRYVPLFGGCTEGTDCGWLQLTRTGVDVGANTISVETDGFSQFVLGGELVPPSDWIVLGVAQGGSVDITVGAVFLSVATTSGQTKQQVAAAVAAAINADATLSAAGITATATENAVSTNGSITSSIFNDPGLRQGDPEAPMRVPALRAGAVLLLAPLLILVGTWSTRRWLAA